MATRTELTRLRRLEQRVAALDALENVLEYFHQTIDDEDITSASQALQEAILLRRPDLSEQYQTLYHEVHSEVESESSTQENDGETG